MRIAIDVLSAALGGPGQYIIDLLPHLARRAADDEIHFLAAHPQLLARLPRLPNVIVHDIPAGRRVARRLLWQRFSMPAWLRQHRIDVLYVAQGLTALRPPPPMVVLHQDSMFFCRERYQRSRLFFVAQQFLTRATLRRAARALFVSQNIRALAESRGWIAPHEGVVVPCGTDTDALRAATDPIQLERLRAEPPFLLCVTSVMPHKNVHGLLDAMAELRRRGRRDMRLLIAGPAPADQPYVQRIRAQIAQQDLSEAVTLLGALDRPSLAAHYQTARLYVTLSFLESFSLTPIEAMAFGTPVLTNDLPVFAEVGDDAYVRVDGANPAAVADAILALWDDETRRRALAERGLARVAHFSWPRAADLVYAALHDAARELPR